MVATLALRPAEAPKTRGPFFKSPPALLVALALLVPTSVAFAASGPTGARTVAGMGCNKVARVCWVDLAGTGVGPTACTSTQIRWNMNDANAEATLSMLMTAYAAGKQVNLGIAATCFENTAFPTMDYVTFGG